MDTESLKTFVTLAEYRNFSRTADALFVAQSTVTNRIAELEREVGRQLFARNKRRVTLTGEGEIYLTYARRMLELSRAGIQAVHTGTRYNGSLRLGTTNTIYECHLLTCDGVSFLPERIALPYMEKGELRLIPLRDFQAPKINCYKIYRQGNEEAAAIG